MIPTDIFKAIKEQFPEDDIDQIMDWYDQATECAQPITIAEYEDWRQYDDCGKLKVTS